MERGVVGVATDADLAYRIEVAPARKPPVYGWVCARRACTVATWHVNMWLPCLQPARCETEHLVLRRADLLAPGVNRRLVFRSAGAEQQVPPRTACYKRSHTAPLTDPFAIAAAIASTSNLML